MSVEHDRFELRRTYPAPPKRVFARWADPALKAGWFSAPGAEYELDFRVGGGEVNRDGTPGGAGFTYTSSTPAKLSPRCPLRVSWSSPTATAPCSQSRSRSQCSTGETSAPRGSEE